MTYNPYTPDWHQVAPPGITLAEYAKAWIDMEPHVGQLTDYASRASVIVEFGVRGGVSTWAMLNGLPAEGRLIGVDVSAGYIPQWIRDDPRFELRVGDSLAVPLPDHADMVMIDSSHEYQHTLAELGRAANMGPAVIALHDYNHRTAPGVRKAIDKFVAMDPRYILAIVHPSDYGLAVLSPA